MKVGEYVRTDDGLIMKIKKIERNGITTDISLNDYSSNLIDRRYLEEFVIKSSPNIIDLIEVGDYVNGLPVESVKGIRFDENDLRVWLAVATKYVKEYGVENSDGDYEFDTLYRCIKPENIKSILTKEQFESMKYRIGE